jgi:outer membrane protein assembly factor BamD
MRFRHFILWLVLVPLAGCASIPFFSDAKDTDVPENWSAEKLYNEAKESMEAGAYSKAVEYYEKLQARYPFGTYAQQAQLDLAYAYYKEEEGASAVAACDRFIKLYPNHSHVDYAFYLKGLANFNQGKGLTERFLPVDASQRDQAAAMKSFEDFSELTKRFPESKYVDDARQRMMYLRNILAHHEVHVANYYMRRGAYIAAANRARYVVENYQRAPVVPDALMLMAKAYRILELNDLSDDALRVLETNYPDHAGLAEVKDLQLR